MAYRKDNFLTKIQTKFSVSRSEAVIVLVILSGLILGSIIKYSGFAPNKADASQEAIYKTLDSLAEINRTAYTGTDVVNKPIPELAKADTVLAKESLFPNSKKKEITSEKINLNSASKVQLMKLPGVGEKTAINILEFRKSQSFRTADDIMKIKGIGPKKFEKMRPFIDVK